MAQEFLFPGFTPALQEQLHTQLRPGSGTAVRTLTRGTLKQPESIPHCPLFVVRGERDRMSSAAACEWLAAHLQADQHTYPDLGYWLYSGPSAITLVTDVHRWIIRALGEPLLVPPDEEDG
jgi:pimeloyl-ACP methyl ester carboxylesterase